MRWPRFASYRDSGVEKLGLIPSHWRICDLQDAASSTRFSFVDGPFGSDLKNEEYVDEGIPLIQLNNIGEGVHSLQSLRFVTAEKAATLQKHCAVPGDIVIAKMAHPVARAAVVDAQFQKYLIVADCIKLSVDSTAFDKRFVQYWLNSSQCKAIAETLSMGVTRLRINLGAVKKLPLPAPPMGEQNAIVHFLDRETAKLDSLKSKQERLIELLQEKHQAFVSHAVTKGLNANARMKDSEIEWLGAVPAHWEVVRLGRLFREVSQPGNDELPLLSVSIHSGVSDREFDVGELERNVARSEDRTKYKQVQPGDLVYNMMRAWQGAFGAVIVRGMVSPAYVVARPRKRIVTSYVEAVLRTPQAVEKLRLHSYGITDFRLRLYWDEFKTIEIPMPPVEEQALIVAALTHQDARLSHLIDKSRRAIDVVREHRTALISAAVTGKINVNPRVDVPAGTLTLVA